MALDDRLAALRRDREAADIRAAYDEFLNRLDAVQIAQDALAVGDPMPPFLLPGAEGHLVDSADLLAAGPLVITFFRGAWCPYCAATLDALEASLPDLARAGATLVGMTPETGGRALAMQREHLLHYEVLADIDLGIALAFGIVFRTPPRYAEMLRRSGIDLGERSGNGAWLLPIPATFLIDRSGTVARRWVDIDFTRRAEPTEVLAALRAL